MATNLMIRWLRVYVVRDARDEIHRWTPGYSDFIAVPRGVSG